MFFRLRRGVIFGFEVQPSCRRFGKQLGMADSAVALLPGRVVERHVAHLASKTSFAANPQQITASAR
jgi:hypothetical protein